jgi:hypothetical protein
MCVTTTLLYRNCEAIRITLNNAVTGGILRENSPFSEPIQTGTGKLRKLPFLQAQREGLINLVFMQQLVSPMYAFPHSQGMSDMPGFQAPSNPLQE